MSVTESMNVPGIRPTVASVSDPGKARNINEDSFWVAPETLDAKLVAEKGWLFIVADGMGGYQGGEVASSIAVQAASDSYYAEGTEGEAVDIMVSLHKAVQMAQQAVLASQAQNANHSQMGSTLVMAVIIGDRLYVANLGDSRCYRLRDGKLEQLSKDHSWVAEQARNGLITPEEARRSANRNLLTRALGQASSAVRPEVEQFDWRNGDRLLMCCDGLWNMVPDADILKMLSNPNPLEAASALVRAANNAGGPDNITTLVIGDLPAAPRQDITGEMAAVTLPRKPLPVARLLATAMAVLVIVAAAGYVVLGQLGAPSQSNTPSMTAVPATARVFTAALITITPAAVPSVTPLSTSATPGTQATQTFSQVLAASTIVAPPSPTTAVLATTTPLPQLTPGDCVTRTVTVSDWQWSTVAVGAQEAQGGGISVWGAAHIATKTDLVSYLGVPELHVPFTLAVVARGIQPKSSDMRLCFQDSVNSSSCLNMIKGAQSLEPSSTPADTWLFSFDVTEQPQLPQLRVISLADRSRPLTIIQLAYCAR
jgi:PPM family protein phosphatase